MADSVSIPIPTLAGKKTYIVAIIGLAFIWLDHFYNLGLSDTCKATPASPCSIPLDQAIQISIGILMGVFIRNGVANSTTPSA